VTDRVAEEGQQSHHRQRSEVQKLAMVAELRRHAGETDYWVLFTAILSKPSSLTKAVLETWTVRVRIFGIGVIGSSDFTGVQSALSFIDNLRTAVK
jgi:hypothetical protein